MDNLDEEKTFKKDRNCRRCELIFDCKGKPQGVELCIRCLLFQNSFRLGGRMMLEVMRGDIGNE